ncbi:MAG TPA: histidine kinase dimerization/phospho-acceptor domain-containing protein, partial [Solirubrobacteraceae bacterium]
MSLRVRLLLALAYVLLLAIVALEVPLASSIRQRVDDEVRSQARAQADVLAATAADLLAPAQRGELQALVTRSGATVRGRVIVVDGQGRLLADSAGSGLVGTSYGRRPEISAALGGHTDQRTRHSSTLGRELLATAVPIRSATRPPAIGAVRVTQSVAAVHRAVRRTIVGLVLIGAVVLGVGLIAGLVIARTIARPMRGLDRAARRVAAGDLEARAAVDGSTEQRALARTFNDMTGRVARLVRSQQDFVADASHQLRTPLTGLRLRLEEARAHVDSPSAIAELDAGMSEIDRLAQILEELLVLSRAGERELPGTLVDLGDAAERAAERWAQAAAERAQRVDADAQAAGSAWCAPAESTWARASSRRRRSPVRGVRSWCEASATKSCWLRTRRATRPVMSLKVRASARCSALPSSSSARASRSPPATRRAAASRRPIGRATRRATTTAAA